MELRRRADSGTRPTRRKQDTVGWYLENIKDSQVLKHDQLVALFQRLESGDKSAFNQIVERNLKLVVAVARAYKDKGVDWEDLLQEGNMGLIHAVEKFDWKRGNRFSTYALWWIRQRISHYMATQRHSIRVPTHAMRLKKHIDRALEVMRRDGEEPTWDSVAEAVSSSAEVVEATVAGSRATLSLSRPPAEGGTSFESEATEPDPESWLGRKEVHAAVEACVRAMDPFDRQVLELRLAREPSSLDSKKLALVKDVVVRMAARGHVVNENCVKTSVRRSTAALAKSAAESMGLELCDERAQEVGSSRAFQEAIASILSKEDM